MSDGLKIIIDAEVQGAIAGLNKVNTGLKSTDKIADEVAGSSKSLTQALDQLGKKGQLSINSLGFAIKDFRTAMHNSTDTGDIKKFGDAIGALTVKQKELVQAAGSSDVFGKAFGGLRQLANILPGFGIAGLIGAAAQGISKLAESIMNDLLPAQNVLSEFNAKFAEVSAGSIANIELLKAKINDSNTSQSQRVELVKDYNREADKQNQIDITQAGNIDVINAKINQQIELLKQRAAVRAAEGFVAQKFEALFNKQLEFKIQFPDLEKNQGDIISKATSFIDKFNAKLKISPQFDTKELLALSDLPLKQLKDLAGQSLKFKIFDDPNAVASLKRFNSELTSSIALTQNLGQAGVFEKMQSDIKGAEKDVDDTLALFSNLLDVQGFSEKSKEKLAKGFEDIKVGIVNGLNDVVKTIDLQPHKLSIPFQLALAEDGPLKTLQFSELKKQLEDALNEFALRESVVPIVIKKQIQIQLEQTKEKDFTKQIEAINKSINDTLNNIRVEALATIGEALGDALTGDNVGNAFKKFGIVLADGIQSIGKKLIELGFLGKQINVAIASLASQPYLSIALGVALVALGQAFKNNLSARALGGSVSPGQSYRVNEAGQEIFQPNSGQMRWITGGEQMFTPPVSGKIIPAHAAKSLAEQFRIKAFSNGGLVFGPTLGLLGEGANITGNNPEVIAPLSELRGMLGIDAVPVVEVRVTGELSGRNISMVQKRDARNQKRNK